MGIKLKSNKIFKIINIIILIIMIMVLPIQLGKTVKSNNVEDTIYNRIRVTNYLYFFNKEVFNFSDWYINLDGEINEESVDRELNNIKLQQEKEFNTRKDYIENGENKESLIEALKKEVIKPDDELRETIVKGRKEHFDENKNEIFKENKNIQFYVKNIQNGSVITNVPGADVDYFLKENSSGYEAFSIRKDTVKYSNEYTPNMAHIVSQIENSNLSSDSIYERYYKIPNSLVAGDYLYEAKMQEENLKSEFRKNVGISFLAIIIFGISIIVAYKNRGKFNNEMVRKYNRLMAIEIKIMSPILVVVNIINMYLNNAEYSRGLGEFLIIFQPILLIITFALINELINTKITEIDYENMKKRSVFYNLKILTIKFIILIKGSFLVESKKIIVMTAIVMTILFYISMFFLNRGMAVALPYKIFVTIFPYIYPIIIIIYILNISNGLNLLKIGSDKIVKGNYNIEIDVKGPKIVKEIAENIKNIEDGFSKAVSDAVKSEKLKGELITNVSHDLKTPLTSIISYVDLLKNENLKDEDREKYIKVLDGKAQRLKVLIEDLFEASKAASGSIEIHKEKIDVSSLLRQTLGEFQEKILTSSLEFINKWPEEKAEVYLDGKKTWRVFENLISNILKYSMKNSRVYIDVIKNTGNVQIIMKNMSAYQLDFTEEEVVERFKRGDKSRNTEGSGLGLSIAKSLTNLQGGTFKIEIDGDLFKVILTFPLN